MINNHIEACKFLLENNADTEIPDQDGMTPLNAAAVMGLFEISKLLIENNANVNTVNTYG